METCAHGARQFCTYTRLGFVPPFYVVFVVSNTTEWEPACTALTGVSGVRLAWKRPLSGPLSGLPEQRKHKYKPRAHKDTHRPQSLSGALLCSEWTDVYPTTFFLGFVQCIKNTHTHTKLFTLIIPFCCLCLFCFALSFFPYIKNYLCEELLPSCFLEQTLP